MKIKLHICAVGVALLAITGLGCDFGAAEDALLRASAQCLHDNGLAQLAGDTTVDETLARLRESVASGEKTIAEIQRAYDMVCAK